MTGPQRLLSGDADASGPIDPVSLEARADSVTSIALLNCLAREIALPAGDLRPDGTDWVEIRLSGTGVNLRARLLRPMVNVSRGTSEPRFTGEVRRAGPAGPALGWRELLTLVDAELRSVTGGTAGSLTAQIESSHSLLRTTLRRRALPVQVGPDHGAVFLELEQSLVVGHRHHPAPKARSGPADEVRRYAPELGAGFLLRRLAVRAELVREIGSPGAGTLPSETDEEQRGVPGGYRALLLHPWQFEILSRGDVLPAALAQRRAIDLGPSGSLVRPTSSVRTVAVGDGFVKLSLSVRITNCLRINPWHEVQAAVLLTGLLEPLRLDLARRFAGTVVLREFSGVTADLGPGLADQLGSIGREGLAGHLHPDLLPVPAAALTEPWPHPVVDGLLARVTADHSRLVDWWGRYLRLLLAPVLYAYARHGVVFEAHLQNVVMALDRDGLPTQLVLRDLEGVKLIRERRSADLLGLPEQVRAHVATSERRGWDRVGYCLLVNHVGGLLTALADRAPDAEPALWAELDRELARIEPFPELEAVLAGGPVPAKTNLLTRWQAAADRDSTYVQLFLPLGRHPTGKVRGG